MIYTSKVIEICENGDAIVELPDELVKELDWRIGDTLDYQMKNKAVYIKNLSKEKRDASAT
jgi:antitoxin component of MazEF toxin-antitoxin module